jgi:phage FluMu gp28-like protein
MQRTKRKVVLPKPAHGVSPLDLLLPYERSWVDDDARFKIGLQARQTGKSFQTSCESVRDCLIHPGSKWVCISAGERQAIEWLEKAKEWAQAFALIISEYAEDRAFAEAILKQAEIRFANGSRIIAIPANPSTARGYSANVVLDEFAYHENSNEIWAAMFPSLTNPLAGTFMPKVHALARGEKSSAKGEPMKIRIASTFNGKNNKFFELWEKKEQNGYSGHQVSIYDAVRQGLEIDIDALRNALDDPDIWAQEYECEATDTSNVLLPYDLIAQAESVDAREICDADFWEQRGAPTFCGIDFGRSNDPTVCWTLQQDNETGLLVTREVLVLKNVDTPEQIELLRVRLKRCTRAAWDYTGPGIGGGDYLAKEFFEYDPVKHEFGKIELCTFTIPFKRELFPKLRRAFESPTKVRVPMSRAVREDLHAMQQIVHNGEYNYWAPRSKEGHSDRCTALALAIRAASTSHAGVITEETIGGIRIGALKVMRTAQFRPRIYANA